MVLVASKLYFTTMEIFNGKIIVNLRSHHQSFFSLILHKSNYHFSNCSVYKIVHIFDFLKTCFSLMMVVIIFWFDIHAKLNDGKTIPNGICLNNVCLSNMGSKLCPMHIPIVKYNMLNTKCNCVLKNRSSFMVHVAK